MDKHTIPFLKEKVKSEGIVSPLEILFLNNHVKSLDELPKAPRCCLLCPSKKVKQVLETELGKKFIEGPKFMKPVLLFDDKAVYSESIGFGAPTWVWTLEGLIAWGVKEFIYIAYDGVINKRIDMNKLQVVTKALSDEGTSRHYGCDNTWSYPDKKITDKLLDNDFTQPAVLWTKDALFKDTKEEAEYGGKNDIDAFDMETSALFNIAKLRGAKIASIQIAVDSYLDRKYGNTYKSKHFDSQVLQATKLALNVMDKTN